MNNRGFDDEMEKLLWETLGYWKARQPEPDLSGTPSFSPPNYTLHACSRCSIYCADNDSHVCNQKLLKLLEG